MISVVIPTRNEAANIARCLASVIAHLSDDVRVIDSCSTDATVSIARQFTSQIVSFRWQGTFPKKRNWALRNCEFRYPWVLFLDADEGVTAAFASEVRTVLPTTRHNGFWLTYEVWFSGQKLNWGVPMRKLALFRVGSGEYEHVPDEAWTSLDMEVHEHPVLTGTTGVIQAELQHRDYKGLHAFIARHNEYSSWEAKRWRSLALKPDGLLALTKRQRWKYWLLQHNLAGLGYFLISYVACGGFLDGRIGLLYACYKSRYFNDIQAKMRE